MFVICVVILGLTFYIGIIDYKGTPDFKDLELFNMAKDFYLKVTEKDGKHEVHIAKRPLVSVIKLKQFNGDKWLKPVLLLVLFNRNLKCRNELYQYFKPRTLVLHLITPC